MTTRTYDLEQLQKLHYERIGAAYESHYGDAGSQRYRERFIDEPMFANIELGGLKVLEAMSGSGQTTEYLLSKGARVTGLDISKEGIDSFVRRWPQCEAICASILSSGLPDNAFDCVAIVGGLHHLQPNLNEAVTEIHRVLKPGGYFCLLSRLVVHSRTWSDRFGTNTTNYSQPTKRPSTWLN